MVSPTWVSIALLCVASCIIPTESVNGCRLKKIPNVPKEYLVVAVGFTFKTLCSDTYIFSEEKCGCIKDPALNGGSVTTQAPTTTSLSTTTPAITGPRPPPPGCGFGEIPNDPYSYSRQGSNQVIISPCPAGTIFKLYPNCMCVQSGSYVRQCIDPEININMQDGTLRSISKRYGLVHVAWMNVEVVNGEAQFNGKGYLFVDLYNDVMFTDGLSISFRFRESGRSMGRQVLLTNCESDRTGTVKPSVEISVDNKVVIFTMAIGEIHSTKVSFTNPGMKNVSFIVGKKGATAYVDGQSSTLPYKGTIESRKQGFFIGNTPCADPTSPEGFDGTMDDIKIYRCANKDLHQQPTTG